MKFEEFVRSKNLSKILLGVIGLMVVVIIFSAGVFVGSEKARFSYDWNTSYYRNFAAPPPPQMLSDRGYLNAHGSAGQIIGIDGNTVTVKSSEGEEKIVLIGPQTVVRENHSDINPQMLKTNDKIVFIGSPNNQGQVEAEFIRVLNP